MDVGDSELASALTKCLLLAAGPQAPGAHDTLTRALQAADGASLEVMLTAEGLAWAQDTALREAAAAGLARVSLCTVAARAAGWTPEHAPSWIAWSGIAIWMLRHADAASYWTVTP